MRFRHRGYHRVADREGAGVSALAVILMAAGALAPATSMAAGGGFRPCLTRDGPGYQARVGELTCVFTPGRVRLVVGEATRGDIAAGRLFGGAPGERSSGGDPGYDLTCCDLLLNDDGARRAPSGRQPRQQRVNVYRGTDRARWLESRPVCDRVVYRDAHRGADLIFSLTDEGLAYELRGGGLLPGDQGR